MANTVIQIKRSSATAAPANGSLSAAEPAYSYLSGKLFLGNTSGDGVVEVGGQYWTDLTSQAFAQANAAFEAANTGNNAAVFTQANAAFDQANTARVHANTAHETSNAAYDQANTSYTHANAAHTTANASFDQANTARVHSNTAHATANAAFDKANSANVLAYNTGIGANAYTDSVGAAANGWANLVAGYANTYANSTFVKLNDGNQTITGDISITGNLSVLGNTTTVSSQNLVIEDPVFLIANNNTTDITDLGFVAHYANVTSEQVHTGLIRDPGTKQWYLFKEYTEHFFYQGGNIDLSGNNFTIDTLNANLKTSNLSLGGANAIEWIISVSEDANDAFSHAATAHGTANASYAFANSAHTVANGAYSHSNAAYAFANSAHTVANGAYSHANAAYDQANTANVNAANASFLTTGTVPTGRLSGSYTGITGVGILTLGDWNANTINVLYGGTGMTSFTQNGVLFGNTTGALKVSAAGTEGQVLTATSAGTPAFSHIEGGTF